MLPKEVLIEVVRSAPLVSIDLIARRPDGAVLLGYRRNRPAQGFWFVPGGRILKGERMAEALVRIVRRELGEAVPVTGWRGAGVFEHLYDDNFAGVEGVGTHYVVLPHCLDVSADVVLAPDDQHDALQWFPVPELLARADVHPYTKAYFRTEGEGAA